MMQKHMLQPLVSTPLRMSLASGVMSAIVTTTLVGLFVGWDGLKVGLAISTACSVPLSYIIARVVFSIQHRLEVQNAELMQVNKELDTFAWTVAHDLKNPLGNIRSFTHTLGENSASMSPQETQHIVERIKFSCDKIGSTIDALLLLARTRTDDIDIQTVDMAVNFHQVQIRLAPLVQDTHTTLTLEGTLPKVKGYGPWIEEIWMNYLTNAIKYGGQPPVITVGATSLDDGTVKFWVRDNGEGLSIEDQSRLFVEFSRLDRHKHTIEGSGLGLSIVERIASRLGGTVAVESEKGQGSQFSFTLPQAG